MKKTDVRKDQIVHSRRSISLYVTKESDIDRALMILSDDCNWKNVRNGEPVQGRRGALNANGVLVAHVKLDGKDNWVLDGEAFVETLRSNLLTTEDYLAKCLELRKAEAERTKAVRTRRAIEKLAEDLGYPLHLEGDNSVHFNEQYDIGITDLLHEIGEMRSQLGIPLKRKPRGCDATVRDEDLAKYQDKIVKFLNYQGGDYSTIRMIVEKCGGNPTQALKILEGLEDVNMIRSQKECGEDDYLIGYYWV